MNIDFYNKKLYSEKQSITKRKHQADGQDQPLEMEQLVPAKNEPADLQHQADDTNSSMNSQKLAVQMLDFVLKQQSNRQLPQYW